jgi:hypothetical protein
MVLFCWRINALAVTDDFSTQRQFSNELIWTNLEGGKYLMRILESNGFEARQGNIEKGISLVVKESGDRNCNQGIRLGYSNSNSEIILCEEDFLVVSDFIVGANYLIMDGINKNNGNFSSEKKESDSQQKETLMKIVRLALFYVKEGRRLKEETLLGSVSTRHLPCPGWQAAYLVSEGKGVTNCNTENGEEIKAKNIFIRNLLKSFTWAIREMAVKVDGKVPPGFDVAAFELSDKQIADATALPVEMRKNIKMEVLKYTIAHELAHVMKNRLGEKQDTIDSEISADRFAISKVDDRNTLGIVSSSMVPVFLTIIWGANLEFEQNKLKDIAKRLNSLMSVVYCGKNALLAQNRVKDKMAQYLFLSTKKFCDTNDTIN